MLHGILGLGCLVKVTVAHLEQGAIEQQAVVISVVTAIGAPLALNLDVAKLGELADAPLYGLPCYAESSRQKIGARPAPPVAVAVCPESAEQAICGIAEAAILDGARRNDGEPA
jgi:hypothetical protein